MVSRLPLHRRADKSGLIGRFGGKSVLNILANPENLRQASLIGVAERLMTDVLASLALAGPTAAPRRAGTRRFTTRREHNKWALIGGARFED